ncbi:MAG: hypothetical protein QME47_06510 [Candidatus Thermoplasmatota archaeon]|nr:hypothetical protein [Candidatus Thermoplasmatota archaeon]
MVKRILVPNRLIAISVPNRNESHAMRSKSYQVSTPEHLTGWSAKALRNFLTSHGF